jgi:hypothetical protein
LAFGKILFKYMSEEQSWHLIIPLKEEYNYIFCYFGPFSSTVLRGAMDGIVRDVNAIYNSSGKCFRPNNLNHAISEKTFPHWFNINWSKMKVIPSNDIDRPIIESSSNTPSRGYELRKLFRNGMYFDKNSYNIEYIQSFRRGSVQRPESMNEESSGAIYDGPEQDSYYPDVHPGVSMANYVLNDEDDLPPLLPVRKGGKIRKSSRRKSSRRKRKTQKRRKSRRYV